MSYTILKSDGTTLTTIADGTVDTISTNLSIPGPNYVGYGQLLNENLVFLLENFASNSVPSGTNLQGQLWFNKSNQTLNVFTDQGYAPVSGVTNSGIQPVIAKDGDIWFNTSTNQTYLHDSGVFKLVGPTYTKSMGPSGAIPVVLDDGVTVGITHNVVQMQFGNSIIATFSTDASFTPLQSMPGFPRIYPGLTINESLIASSAQFYANANTAAYLPIDGTITGIKSSIVATNAAILANVSTLNNTIVTANSAVVSYVDDQITATTNSWTANAIAQANQLTGANAAIVTANLAVVSYVNSLNATMLGNVTATNSNVANVTVAWTANAVAQQTQINTLQTQVYANANVAAYLLTNTGNIKAGVITANTPAYNNNSNTVATTSYVNSVLPQGVIVMWGGATNTIPTGWQLCDGSNGTPNLRDRFIVGAGSSYAPGANAGVASNTISGVAAHAHTVSLSGVTNSGGSHTHSATSTVTDSGHRHPIFTPGGNGSVNLGNDLVGDSGYQTTQRYTGVATTGITVATGISSAADHTHSLTVTGSTDSTGTGQTLDNRPPFYALCYIQKMY